MVKIIFLQARIYLKLQIYGSILGPFVSVVIYANDLANVLESCQVTLFADDTVLLLLLLLYNIRYSQSGFSGSNYKYEILYL